MNVTIVKTPTGRSNFTARWSIIGEDGRTLYQTTTVINGGTRRQCRDYAAQQGWTVTK